MHDGPLMRARFGLEAFGILPNCKDACAENVVFLVRIIWKLCNPLTPSSVCFFQMLRIHQVRHKIQLKEGSILRPECFQTT